MISSYKRRIIEEVRSHFRTHVVNAGFSCNDSQSGLVRRYYDKYHDVWNRRSVWKIDRVRLVYPVLEQEDHVGMRYGVSVDATVVIPCSGYPIGSCELDAMSREHVLPAYLHHVLLHNRFTSKVMTDISQACAFCDSYCNPSVALERLVGGLTWWRGTTGKGRLKVEAMREYLMCARET